MAAPDADEPSEAETISAQTARTRCATSEWIEERDWLREIQARAGAGGPETAGDALTVGEWRKRREPLVEALRARFEHAVVSEDDAGGGDGWMHFRLGPGTVYRVGPTLRSTMADFLGAILRILTGGKYFVLMMAWTGFAGWKLVKTLVDGFERLANPVEREVFEELFAASARVAVVDFTALQRRDYDGAYGRIAPTAAEIAAGCPTRSLPEVETALRAMEKREILVQKDGRWSVRF